MHEGYIKQSAAIAHFRQLCCLGLDSQMVIPSVLEALHELIGSATNAFFWSAETGDITNVYHEHPMPRDIASLYFGEFVNNRNREDSTIRIGALLPHGKFVGNSARLFPGEFYDSDFYNLIWQPLRWRSVLWARGRDASNRLNGLALHRLAGDRPFSTRDEELLARLVPYIAHAASGCESMADQTGETAESGLVIVDRQARVQYESASGHRLMLLATHPRIAPGTVDWLRGKELPQVLAQMCECLEHGVSGCGEKPPFLHLQNAWGRFVCRAFRLEGSDPMGNHLIGITLERKVPLKIKLLQTMNRLALSQKQKEVCLLLAEGRPHLEIAARLGVKPYTVADHVRKIYHKLDVHNREELLARLHNAEARHVDQAELPSSPAYSISHSL